MTSFRWQKISGLIEELGKWVIFSSARQLSQWVKKWDIYVSLNLCAREFGNSELVEIVGNALANADNLDPKHLKLEITESEGIKNPDKFIKRIEMLKKLGVEIYIDDFGTGQSSLEYLKSIPAEILKIDKIFVDGIHTSVSDREFLEAMVALVKTRGKQIITEGIGCRGAGRNSEGFGLRKDAGVLFFGAAEGFGV